MGLDALGFHNLIDVLSLALEPARVWIGFGPGPLGSIEPGLHQFCNGIRAALGFTAAIQFLGLFHRSCRRGQQEQQQWQPDDAKAHGTA